jgi:hypothetical protein
MACMAGKLSSHFQLNATIDCNVAPYNAGDGWAPIGTLAAPFTGYFDGNNHTIDSLFIDRANQTYVGLFGYATLSATDQIVHVALKDADITGGNYTGGIVGYVNTPIGGIGNKVVRSVWLNGTVTGDKYVGGILGHLQWGALQGAYVHGDISGSVDTGGLIGEADGAIYDSYSEGTVVGDNVGGIAGGIVGYISSYTLDNCFSVAEVYGSLAAGIAGYASGGIGYMSNNYWFDWSTDDAVDCVGLNSNSCTLIADIADMYNVTNEPMSAWAYPEWSDFCSPAYGLPALEDVGLAATSQCLQIIGTSNPPSNLTFDIGGLDSIIPVACINSTYDITIDLLNTSTSLPVVITGGNISLYVTTTLGGVGVGSFSPQWCLSDDTPCTFTYDAGNVAGYDNVLFVEFNGTIDYPYFGWSDSSYHWDVLDNCYQVIVSVNDSDTGSPLSGVNVNIGVDSADTGTNGETTPFTHLAYTDYPTTLTKSGYDTGHYIIQQSELNTVVPMEMTQSASQGIPLNETIPTSTAEVIGGLQNIVWAFMASPFVWILLFITLLILIGVFRKLIMAAMGNA